MTDDLVGALQDTGADLKLLTEPHDTSAYATDASRRDTGPPALVIRPGDTAAVSTALRICHGRRQPVVVQGGRTGLSGGARVREGEVALSFDRMRALSPVDPVSLRVVAEAGATIASVHEAAANAGLAFGVDWGARGTATVGGGIATNAGGVRVLRHGMFRNQVAGVEAVLADGTIVSDMRGLDKNNAGFSLTQILTGSEGTLAAITRASLRLLPAPAFSELAICALTGIDSAIALLARLRQDLGPALTAAEAMWPEVYAGASGMLGRKPLPVGAGLYLLVEMQGFARGPRPGTLAEALAPEIEAGRVADAVLARSGREIAELWRLREACTEWSFSLGRLTPHDLSLPPSTIPVFLLEARAAVAKLDPEALVLVYGHLGDGNLHYLVRTTRGPEISQTVNALAAAMGGSVTAEHGLGLDKTDWLPLVVGPAERALMQRLRLCLDPASVLNPDRVIGRLCHAEPTHDG